MAAADVIVKSETFIGNENSCEDSYLDNHSDYNIYDPGENENDDYKMHELLREFDLEILYTILKIGDVTFRSLKYISESDINDVIRSIAYRSEFREKLFAWRRDKFGFNDLSILPPSPANNTQIPSSEVPTNFSNLNKNTILLDGTTESYKNQETTHTRSMSATVAEMPAAKIRKISATRTITTPAATITPRSSPNHSISNPPFKETLTTNLPRESGSPILTYLPSTSASTDQSMDYVSSYSLQPTTSQQAKALASAATAVEGTATLTPPTANTAIPKLGINPEKKDSINFLKRMQPSASNFLFDLKSLLEEHPLGRALYKNGTYQRKLISLHRSMLCDIIIWKLLKTNRSVTNSDYLEIATQIVQLFPEECIETYYVAPVKKANSKLNISEVAKGKLPDKFRNLRAVIRGAERLGTPSTFNSENKKHSKEYMTAEKSQLWLLHNREATEIRQHWNISYILRESDVEEKKYTNVEDIFSMWPILKEPRGFELIEHDFVKKFPNCEDHFMSNWDNFFPRLLTLYQKKISEQDLIYKNILEDYVQTGNNMKLHPDSKTAIQFYLLASLMAPKANKVVLKSKDNDCKATFWKPTIAESREGIILQVGISEDIQRVINEKKSHMLKMGLPLQPLVVTIGTGPTDIKKVYVWIESITYELPSLLKALDVLLKFYLVFNLPYPLECENYCYLIQWGLYKIRTKSDTQIPFVYNTLNMLKNQNN